MDSNIETQTTQSQQELQKYPTNTREWKLIERLLINAQDTDRKERRWRIIFRVIGLLYLVFIPLLLIGPRCSQLADSSPNKDFAAVIKIHGAISSETDANANDINYALRKAFKSEAKAIILDINSPGGSPVQSGYVYDEITRLREKHDDKKVYAVISELGASAAYYIASAADEIYVDKASIVGSIGVIMQNFNAQELMQKIGVKPRTLTAGANKDILSPFSELTESQQTHVQTMLDEVHQQFINAVKAGRGDRLQETPDIFSGLFWSGESSISLGLADGLGNVDSIARETVGVEKKRDFSRVIDPLEKVLKKYGASISSGMLEKLEAQQQPELY